MSHAFWARLGVATAAIVLSFVAAKLIDRRLARRQLAPGTVTRYRILRQSILRRDLPMTAGIILFMTFAIVLLNLAVDLAYSALDPRVRRAPLASRA